MDCSMPDSPVHHQLLEFAQTHVYQAGDAIQPSHPLSSPSPPAFKLSQHQGLFQRLSSLHQVVKVLAKESDMTEPLLPLSPSDYYLRFYIISTAWNTRLSIFNLLFFFFCFCCFFCCCCCFSVYFISWLCRVVVEAGPSIIIVACGIFSYGIWNL